MTDDKTTHESILRDIREAATETGEKAIAAAESAATRLALFFDRNRDGRVDRKWKKALMWLATFGGGAIAGFALRGLVG